jgi:hypothetical protein
VEEDEDRWYDYMDLTVMVMMIVGWGGGGMEMKIPWRTTRTWRRSWRRRTTMSVEEDGVYGGGCGRRRTLLEEEEEGPLQKDQGCHQDILTSHDDRVE